MFSAKIFINFFKLLMSAFFFSDMSIDNLVAIFIPFTEYSATQAPS